MRALSIAALAALAACGPEPSSTSEAVSAGSRGGPATSVAPAGWNALDACAALGDARAAGIMGAAVAGSELTVLGRKTASTAATSMCLWRFESGATLALILRDAPVDEATPEEIERARTTDGTLSPARDLPGLGMAALWSDERRQMQVFLDQRRRVIVNLFGVQGSGLEIATAVVEAVS